MSREVVRLSGFSDLDKALGELPKRIAKNVLVRTLRKAGEPIAEMARDLVPIDRGDLKASIAVSTRLKNPVGKAEFAAAMRSGLGKAAAVGALRDARRAAGGGTFAEMFVGPGPLPYAHMQEFGTVKMEPRPYLRPAWDAKRRDALGIIKKELGTEIIMAAKRIARNKRQSVDVKYRASLAAMMAAEQGY